MQFLLLIFTQSLNYCVCLSNPYTIVYVQAIPKTDIILDTCTVHLRKAFVPNPGYILVSAGIINQPKHFVLKDF